MVQDIILTRLRLGFDSLSATMSLQDGVQKIVVFVERMKKLGIEMELSSNYPWLYLHKVNGNHVTEKFQSDGHYTIAFGPIRTGEQYKFTDIGKMFDIIRKYRCINTVVI